MKWALAFASLVALVGCHDKDKDRGTCMRAARCVVGEQRSTCASDGVFTEEDPPAGQVRCKAAGFEAIDPQATSCEGGYTGTFDMRRGGTVPDDMIKSALNNACAINFTKAR